MALEQGNGRSQSSAEAMAIGAEHENRAGGRNRRVQDRLVQVECQGVLCVDDYLSFAERRGVIMSRRYFLPTIASHGEILHSTYSKMACA